MDLLTSVLVTILTVTKVPSAANSTFPTNGIYLVGFNASNSPEEDQVGQFEVTIRNFANLPVDDGTVTLNFIACTPDIRVSPVQTFPGVSVLCDATHELVSAQTDGEGKATLRILGSAMNAAGNGSGVSFECAELRCNGVFLSTLSVATLDQAGTMDGAQPNDVAVVIADINAGSTVRRSDFNFDHALLPNDLALMIAFVNSGRSAQNTGATCP